MVPNHRSQWPVVGCSFTWSWSIFLMCYIGWIPILSAVKEAERAELPSVIERIPSNNSMFRCSFSLFMNCNKMIHIKVYHIFACQLMIFPGSRSNIFSKFRAHVLTLDQLVNLTFPHVCSLNHQKSIVFEVNNLLSRVQIPMFLTEILTCWERISCWPPLECTGTLQPELVPNFHHFHHFCSSFSMGKSPDFHHFLCRSSNFHHVSIIFPRYHLVI